MRLKLARTINVLGFSPVKLHRKTADFTWIDRLALISISIIYSLKPGVYGLQTFWFLYTVVFLCLVPITAILLEFVWIYRIKKEENRTPFIAFWVSLFSFAIGSLGCLIYHSPHAVLAICAAYLATGVLVALLKRSPESPVSIYAAGVGGAIMLLVYFLNWWWALGFLLIILVGWSRMVTAHLSYTQVLAGGLAGAAMTAVSLFVFYAM